MEQDKPVLINDKDAAEFLQERITAQEQRVSKAMNELREAKALKKALEKALNLMRDIDIVPGYSYSGKHIPTGEMWWIIGIDLVGDRVCAAGWPPSIGKLSDMQDMEVEEP